MFRLRATVAPAAMILCLIIGLTDRPWSAAQSPPTSPSLTTPTQPSGGCTKSACDFGGGATGGTGGSSGKSSGGGGGGGGPTTCTATDFTKNPPQKVTGPITSKPAFGAGGEWQYPEGPAGA